MDIISGINLVIETLQGLNIQSTRDNMDKLLGSIQLLDKIRDTIIGMTQQQSELSPDSEPEPAEDIPVEVEEVGNESDE